VQSLGTALARVVKFRHSPVRVCDIADDNDGEYDDDDDSLARIAVKAPKSCHHSYPTLSSLAQDH